MPVKNRHLPLIVVLFSCIFCYVILHLTYGVFYQAYLWDELGVYSRAAIYLYEHTLSIFPDAIPDELSRGHPNLCAFYYALWFKLFNCSPFIGHLAAAFLYIGSITLVFFIAKLYVKDWYAALIAFSLFLNPFFLAQSVLILPESMLMLTALAALYSYLKNQPILTSICLVLALQVKESAIVLPLAFLLSELWQKKSFHLKPFILLFAIPIASFAVFLLIQKVQRGYYFYPLHTSLLQFDPYYIKLRWKDFVNLFLNYPSFLLILLVLIPLIRIQNTRNASVIFVLIVLGGIGFTIFNYYLDRYTQFFLMPLSLGAFIYIVQKNIKVFFMCIGVYFLLIFISFEGNHEFKDTDFSYTYHISNVQDVLSELDKKNYSKSTVKVDFPLAAAYWGDKNGYKRKADYTICLNSNDSADYAVFTQPGNIRDTTKLVMSGNYKLHTTISNKKAYSVIYKRITK